MQIRDVPDATRKALRARAASRGQSLNAYLLEVLAREVARPTVAEVLERAARRSRGSDVSAVDALRSGRQEREQELLDRAE